MKQYSVRLKFPSPLGDYVFNHKMSSNRTENMKKHVSVPSRGLCFQSNHVREKIRRLLEVVSVPSRGLCFQSRPEWYQRRGNRKGFRPLSGIMFSIRRFERMVNATRGIVSVPSRGLCFQSKSITIKQTHIAFVSVPSRGLCFQS